MARLVYGLMQRPYGWSFSGIAGELGISERTLMRYLAACRRELVDSRGKPIIQTETRGQRRIVRLASSTNPGDAGAYEILFLYFALAVFQFLEGTVIKDGVTDLWERFAKRVSTPEKLRLEDFRRKFHVIPYAMKDYRDHDETLDVIVQCLVNQHPMRIDYAGLLGDGKTHDFAPYSLMLYRGGLYLAGKSSRGDRIINLAVERIRGATKLDGRFKYPATYSPSEETEGTFGLIAGPETAVELLVMNAETTAYLESRRIHPSQAFRKRRDGKTVLTMKVRGTEELKNWIAGFGPYLKVLKPAALRAELRDLHASAAALYD